MPFVVRVAGGRPPAEPLVELLRRLGRPGALPAGDDVAVLADPVATVDAVLRLVRHGARAVGVGAGPLPPGPGRGAGPAVLAAAGAVAAAPRRPARVAVRGALPVEASDAQAVLAALAALVRRRSAAAWAAVDLVAAGRSQAAAAAELGVSRQAVGQRLLAGGWDLECELRPTAARLLGRAEG